MKKYILIIFLSLLGQSIFAQNTAIHLTINSGKHLTNNSSVKLVIAGPHATQMMLSNNESFSKTNNQQR